jgi:hypothetical protein
MTGCWTRETSVLNDRMAWHSGDLLFLKKKQQFPHCMLQQP